MREAAGAGVRRGEGNLVEEALENIGYVPAPPHGGTVGVDPLELATALVEAVQARLRDAVSDGEGRADAVRRRMGLGRAGTSLSPAAGRAGDSGSGAGQEAGISTVSTM
ncbi:hypothetical protein ACW14Y_01755 [Kitasatospora sp. cg17-2]